MDASLHVPFKSGPESRHHLDSRGGRDAVYGLDHCRGQRRSYLEESLMLHTLQLPPSPQLSLDGRHASSFDLSHSSTTPLQSTFGSRSTSEDAVSWRMHMCLQPTPAPAQPSSPISLDGFGSQFDYLQLQQQQHAQSFQSESSSYPVAGTGVSPEISPLMASSGLSNEMDVTQSHLYGLPPPSHAINYHDPAIYDIQHGREIGYPQIPQPSPDASPSYSSCGSTPRYIYPQYEMEVSIPHSYQHSDQAPPHAAWSCAPSLKPSEVVLPISSSYIQTQWVDVNVGSSSQDHQDAEHKCPSARCRLIACSQDQLKSVSSISALPDAPSSKHQLKHMKMHHCRFESCSRTEGFATPNDRERHEKSIHKIPGCYWKCLDVQCSSYGKEFSRRDNLKDHLRRMHPAPDGMSENEASSLRSRMADIWRFDKVSGTH